MNATFRHALVAHPSRPAPAGCALSVAGRWSSESLVLEYEILCGPDAWLDDPAPNVAPMRRDELWRHTCCEAFVAYADGPGYHEFNFSPTGDWAAYDFAAERTGRVDHAWLGPDPVVRSMAGDAPIRRLLVTLPRAALERVAERGPLRAAYTAVLAWRGVGSTFWALHHPRPAPDFHARDGFVATLEVP